ncbi:hypothetical protein EC968_008318 [Mortierella alpina]|nr:hypothetical protein EC968_008318 [Mortierella alpina]
MSLATDAYDEQLERILLADLEADMDEVDEAFEEAIRDAGNNSNPKEPSRARLRSLEAVLKMLIESPSITLTIDANYVGKQAHKGQTFTPQERRVVAYLANIIRPYVPKRRTDDNGLKPPIAHVTTRAPFMVLGNALLRATGYHPFTKRICPLVSPSSTQALLLSAPAVYETLCSPAPGHFDIKAADHAMLTSVNNTTSAANKRAVFDSFFDLDKVNSLCASHGLEFADWITYVDRYAVYLTGKVIPHGSNRAGYPSVSNFESRKKKKQARTLGASWTTEFENCGQTKKQLEEKADRLSQQTKEQEAVVAGWRKKHVSAEQLQAEAAREVSQLKRGAADGATVYASLRDARVVTRQVRTSLSPEETKLRLMRRQLYALNKMIKAPAISKTKRPTTSPQLTHPNWDHPHYEDSTELLDITALLEGIQDDRQVVMAGTDYGLRTMSVTVPQTLSQCREHIDRYHGLTSESTGEPPPSGSGTSSNSQERRERVKSMKLPRPFKITAKYINNISHSRQTARKREHRLQMDDRAKAAQDGLAKNPHVLNNCQTLHDIDVASTYHRQVAPTLRSFETSKARIRDTRNQQLRIRRSWQRVAAQERSYIRDYGR